MEPALQIRLPIYILIGATTILGISFPDSGTLLFMNWTADNGLANFVRYFYNQNEIKTFNQELKIVINTVYYFSLLVIIFYGIGAVYSLAKKKDEDNAAEPQFTQTTNEALSIGFQVFLIFVAFFYYLLNNDGGTQYLIQMTFPNDTLIFCHFGSSPAGWCTCWGPGSADGRS